MEFTRKFYEECIAAGGAFKKAALNDLHCPFDLVMDNIGDDLVSWAISNMTTLSHDQIRIINNILDINFENFSDIKDKQIIDYLYKLSCVPQVPSDILCRYIIVKTGVEYIRNIVKIHVLDNLILDSIYSVWLSWNGGFREEIAVLIARRLREERRQK